MSFAGIDDDQVRADVIDYLHTLSPNPLPLPPATERTDATKPAPPAAPAAGGIKTGEQTSGPQTDTQKTAGSTSTAITPAPAPSGNPAGQ
jgi:cytochrome c